MSCISKFLALVFMSAFWGWASFQPGKLQRVLLDERNTTGGDHEERRDLRVALQDLAAQNGFELVVLSNANRKDDLYYSRDSLQKIQVVVLANNDGLDRFFPDSTRLTFETWIRNGGGVLAVHTASAFISNWPFIQSAFVQTFYSPWTQNQPSANLSHDSEGMDLNSETRGIFHGLTAPTQFQDVYISFKASPRGQPGVTVLVTVDEKSYSTPVPAPMGDDHPLVWTQRIGLGRFVYNSLGGSRGVLNVYSQMDGYLKALNYNLLRYAAGEFLYCSDSLYKSLPYDVIVTRPKECQTSTKLLTPNNQAQLPGHRMTKGQERLNLEFTTPHKQQISLYFSDGKPALSGWFQGPGHLEIPTAGLNGLFFLRTFSNGKSQVQRIVLP